jgi:hypothetical protein
VKGRKAERRGAAGKERTEYEQAVGGACSKEIDEGVPESGERNEGEKGRCESSIYGLPRQTGGRTKARDDRSAFGPSGHPGRCELGAQRALRVEVRESQGRERKSLKITGEGRSEREGRELSCTKRCVGLV